ncbi:MAG: flippase-like domain-containing protein [Deltaproteobacteria bacterium]|nr:flippase-like domain-containing protein [Deltaproteobacteria bacterium]
MKKKLVVGLFLGGLLVYLSVRGINFQDVVEGFKSVNYRYILPVLIILLCMQGLRSLRWGLILSPIEKVDQFSLFSVTSVGFLAIVAIPARLGELVRPYLIANKSHIKMSAALGTIFVERVFDSLTVLIIFFFVLFITPLPSWLIQSGAIFLLITVMAFAVMIFMFIKRDPSLEVLNRLLRKLPEKYSTKINRLLHHFIDGFAMITNLKLLFNVGFLSILIWLINAVAIYFMFLSFGFTLPPEATLVLMIVLMIGIVIPAAPGFIGNWHFFCILALSFYGIPKTEALTFAVIYHFISIGLVIILGLVFLPFNKFSYSDLTLQVPSGQN